MISLPHKIRKLFLSPDSKFELWLRTQYHTVMATRTAFNLQDLIAKYSYHRWRTKLNNQECFDNDQLIHNIKISFVISLGDSNSDGFKKTITSLSPIPDQYKDVHVVEKGDTHRSDLSVQYLDDYNIHQLSSDMTDLLDLLSGDFVIFCQAGDQFHKNFFQQFSQYSSIYTETEVFYYDCEYYEPNTKRLTPFFKPQKISPALMLSTNMLSRSLISLSVLKEIWKSVDFNLSFQALEYEFCLILCENGINYRHIPRLLLTQVSPVISDDADNAKAISQYLVTKGLKGVTVDHSHTLPRFTWQSNNPSVAIIIPTRNNADYLEPLLKTITATTENINYSINLVDNGSDDQNTLDFYSSIENDEKIKIISYDKPFNYSDAINIGVNQTDSDLILLMNDDMLVKNNEWLSELIQWAILPEVGVVGAKLLHLNQSIQHAGIILGLTGFMGHLYLNAPEHYHGLFGSVDWYRNFLAVTGALQMMRREIFNKVGGYDQGYKLAFGDIDFCLRVYQASFQIVYTPYAQIYHHEGSSRGYTTPSQDVLKGYDVMNEYIINGDPYFSPTITTTRIPRCQTHRVTYSDRLKQIEDRRKFYLR